MSVMNSRRFMSDFPFGVGSRAVSFNHFVGERDQLRRHFEPERGDGPLIDDEFKLIRRLDRKLLRLRVAKDSVNIGGNLPMHIGRIGSIRNQAAADGEIAKWIDGR